MKTAIRAVAVMLVAAVLSPAVATAERFTMMQENLIGLPNRFAIKVSDFEQDGSFSPSGLKALVEERLSSSGLNLVSELSSSPLAIVNVNVVRDDSEKGEGYNYLVDVNVYNLTVLETKYKLRKGTVWHMGSYSVKPTEEFPKEVEEKILDLLRYLVHDYAVANPGIGRQEEASE